MLQPSQLNEVAARDARQVAELRRFLRGAGIAVEGPESLHAVTTRLRQDAAFSRDLTLHIWVLLDGLGSQAGYPELVAALALAAAGQQFAAAASDADAHALLRFLMEARRSFEAGATPDVQAEAPQTKVFRASTLEPGTPLVPGAIPTLEARLLEETTPSRNGRRLVTALASLLLVAAVGGVLYHRSALKPAGQPARVAAPSVQQPIPRDIAVRIEPAPGKDTGAALGGGVSGLSLNKPLTRAQPLRGSSRIVNEPRSQPGSITPSVSPSLVVAPNRATPMVAAAIAMPAPVVSAAAIGRAAPVLRVPPASANVKTVPAETLSNRLGARTIPTYAATDDRDSNGKGWHYPRLLRRHPAGASPAGSESELVAEVQPSDLPTRPGSARGASTAPVGTVRPGSLGIMAGNIVYSPAPAYPAAASAAHVQGEVKLQAEVDRDGNVTYARVVSGPPLLRDAALDAVQHWRYRPYLAHGKPIPMTAAAVMEFELP